MKKSILSIGLLSLVMILTSFTTPETTTIIIDNNTETVNGSVTSAGSRKLDGSVTSAGSRKLDGSVTSAGSRKLD